MRSCGGKLQQFVTKGYQGEQQYFFERLYWFQDWAHLSPELTFHLLPHPHCSIYNYFSISVKFFPGVAPHFWSAHDSPSNLDNSPVPSTRGGSNTMPATDPMYAQCLMAHRKLSSGGGSAALIHQYKPQCLLSLCKRPVFLHFCCLAHQLVKMPSQSGWPRCVVSLGV